MKFLVILSILSLSVYITSASLSSDTCNWYNSAKAVIGKLTPQGQKGALKVLQDYQLYAGAAVQPVYDYLGQLYKNEIASVNASDSAQLAKLQVFLGVGNYKFGAGPLADPCVLAIQLEALVAGFKQQNQANVWKVLGSLGEAVRILYKPLMAVVYVNNYDAANNLAKTENPANLAALAQVFGY